jgi:hypothetical protein
MRRRIRTLAASIGLAVIGIAGAATSTGVTALAANSAPEIEGVAGGDTSLWLRVNPGPWLGFNGGLAGAPAIASLPNEIGSTETQGTPFVVVTGLDHDLWTFNQQRGWVRLSTSRAFCIDNPAAVITSAHAAGGLLLTVACQGGDHALWFAQALVGSGLAPFALNWQSLGGGLSNGPGVAVVDPIHNSVAGELTFFATTPPSGIVWTRTLLTGWSPSTWACSGHPAAGATLSTQIPSGEVTVFACQGKDHSLWFSHNFGGGWIDTQSLGGGLLDGPGVAVGPTTATFFVEGTDHSMWHRTITHGGNVFNWTSDGGFAQFGAGATALLFRSDNP